MPGDRCRRALVLCALALVAACGSSRTEIPVELGTTVPGTPLLPASTTSVPLDSETTVALGSVTTTTSPFQTAGLKHTLSSGATLVVSYPNNSARPPKDVPPAPEGASYAVVTAKLCASKTAPIPGEVVDPRRFSVEVPGHGLVGYDPAVPTLRAPALPAGTAVQPGACLEGTVSFVIRGERHIESITYDAGEGLFRWVT